MSSQTAHREEEEESGSEEQHSLKKVFRDKQGNPIWFFLHKSINLDWQRQNLTNDIESNGGIVRSSDSDVDTVLVGHGCNKDNLQLAYNVHSKPSKRRIWVESMSFVSRCLREGAVRHSQLEPKGMGGLPGSDRTPFTIEDDENLARYLAIRIPDVKSGGRSGNNVYKELYHAVCSLLFDWHELHKRHIFIDSKYSEDPEEFRWVTRHTWQSWRNRYNKSVARFNDMINVYVKLEKPENKQAYRLQRKPKEWRLLNESGEENEEQSGYPSKRRRYDSSPDPENRVQIRITVPENARDMHREPSPFNADLVASEPGPSKRTPIITYARRLRKRPHVSPPLHDPEPYTSQATLVGTNHRTQEPRPRKRTVVDSPSQHGERSKVTWRAEVQEGRSPLLTKELLAAPMPAQVVGKSASTKTDFSSQHKLMARKTAAPPESTVIVSSIPSHRNTRSRSRSVEPYIQPSRLETREVEMVFEHHSSTLPLLEESVNENHQRLVGVLETRRPLDFIGELSEEERSVEELLANSINGRSQATDESAIRTMDNPSAQSAKYDGPDEPTSLDSDDAQTDNWLRQPQIRARTRLPPEEPDVGPDEMLRRFREASIKTFDSPRESSVQPISSSQARAGSRRPRQSAPVYSQDILGRGSLTEQQPRTPATNPRFRLRRGSISSIESFPIAGTKASVVKKTIEAEEKHTPYRPPVGTRAALLTEKQQRPRSLQATLKQ